MLACRAAPAVAQQQRQSVVSAASYPSVDAAVAALGGAPGVVQLPPGDWTTTSTVMLASGQSIRALVPCMLHEAPGVACGAVIRAASGFPANSPVIQVNNASGVQLDGFTIDCAKVPGCIALQYDSTNKPSSSMNQFTNLTMKEFHFGFVNGAASQTPDASCGGLGCQADTFSLEGFQMFGNCSDPTAEGIIINSSNAAQNSAIRRGNIQCVNIAVEGVKSNGMVSFIDFNAGSHIGANPTFMQMDRDMGSYLASGVEEEGTWTYCIHDSSAPSKPDSNIWEFSFFTGGCTNLVDGNARITSLNNSENRVKSTANTGSFVTSIDEVMWEPALNVTVIGPAGSTFGAQIKSLGSIAATASGAVAPITQAGDLLAARSATAGLVALGSDGKACVSRNAIGDLTSCSGGVLTRTSAAGMARLGPSAIPSLGCSATVSVPAARVTTTDAVAWSFGANPAPGDSLLSVVAWPTNGSVNFKQCNPTGTPITAAGAVLNFRVYR